MSGDPTVDVLGEVLGVTQDDARAAAALVARRLGDECRPVLEALGLVGYVGHAGERNRVKTPVWRKGSVNG